MGKTICSTMPAKKRKKEEAPAKKAKVVKAAEPKIFAEVLLDICKALLLSSRVKENDPEEIAETYQVVKTEDFSAAKPVLDLLPEAVRVPLMRLSMMYSEQFEEENCEDFAYADSDEDTEEESDEDVQDAE